MGTERIEELLEQLIVQNKALVEGLQDVVAELKEIHGELTWVQENSFARVTLERLEAIEKVFVAESGSIQGELNWVQENSFAKVVVDGLDQLASAIRDSSQ